MTHDKGSGEVSPVPHKICHEFPQFSHASPQINPHTVLFSCGAQGPFHTIGTIKSDETSFVTCLSFRGGVRPGMTQYGWAHTNCNSSRVRALSLSYRQTCLSVDADWTKSESAITHSAEIRQQASKQILLVLRLWI